MKSVRRSNIFIWKKNQIDSFDLDDKTMIKKKKTQGQSIDFNGENESPTVERMEIVDQNCNKTLKISKDSSQTPGIILFDSLRTGSKNRVAATLREFLQLEFDHKKTLPVGSLERKVFNVDTIGTIEAAVPQQPNYFDCGLYILQYIESFFAHRSLKIDLRSTATFADWCESTTMGSWKRKQIFDIIDQRTIVKEECWISSWHGTFFFFVIVEKEKYMSNKFSIRINEFTFSFIVHFRFQFLFPNGTTTEKSTSSQFFLSREIFSNWLNLDSFQENRTSSTNISRPKPSSVEMSTFDKLITFLTKTYPKYSTWVFRLKIVLSVLHIRFEFNEQSRFQRSHYPSSTTTKNVGRSFFAENRRICFEYSHGKISNGQGSNSVWLLFFSIVEFVLFF